MENNNDKFLRIYDSLERDNNRRDEILNKVYEVGYKKPPISGQFKKGQSGNPRGRKKKVIPKTIIEALQLAFIKEITITNEKGNREKISLIEAFAQKIIQDAIKKDGPTRKMILQDMNFLKFDFLRMLEEMALKDFEPETSKIDSNYFREKIINAINEKTKSETEEK